MTPASRDSVGLFPQLLKSHDLGFNSCWSPLAIRFTRNVQGRDIKYPHEKRSTEPNDAPEASHESIHSSDSFDVRLSVHSSVVGRLNSESQATISCMPDLLLLIYEPVANTPVIDDLSLSLRGLTHPRTPAGNLPQAHAVKTPLFSSSLPDINIGSIKKVLKVQESIHLSLHRNGS